MAGREFGPPPSIIKDFDETWKRWLNLIYRKVYKRTFIIFIQAIEGIGDGVPNNTLQEGLIGIAPVVFGQDDRRMNRNYSWAIPDDWVIGTDFQFAITYANVNAQSGDVSVVSEINFGSTAQGEDLSLPGTPIILVAPLQTSAPANTLHSIVITVPSNPVSLPGRTVQFELARNGQDAQDTCVGDVGYKQILIRYQGYINHE